MARCQNCGMEIGPDETCVFATFKTEVGGQQVAFCCQRCSAHGSLPPAPAAKPARSPRKRPARPRAERSRARKKAAPARRARRKASRAGRKAAGKRK